MEYILKKGEVMSLAAAAFPVIRVKKGVVWLTRADDPRDYFLQRGDSFDKSGEGLVVLESLSDCAFDIQCPETAPPQLTIRLTLTGPQRIGI
ncbi:MAG: DUF2917 domain-containing protein [Desulfuromonadaceae bacterium]|nr:DUF2917 domain-containing protein [Desulfuromonadaceae bacterium]